MTFEDTHHHSFWESPRTTCGIGLGLFVLGVAGTIVFSCLPISIWLAIPLVIVSAFIAGIGKFMMKESSKSVFGCCH